MGKYNKEELNKNIITSDNSKRNKIQKALDEIYRKFSKLYYISKDIKIADKGSSTAGGYGSITNAGIDVNADVSEEKLEFILAHEIFHKYNGDLMVEGGIPAVWNIAMDAVINDELSQNGWGVKSGGDGISIPHAGQMGKDVIYEKLVKMMAYMTADENEQGASIKNNEESNEESNEQGEEPNVRLTKAEFELAICGNEELWEKAEKYLEQKEKAKEKQWEKENPAEKENENEQGTQGGQNKQNEQDGQNPQKEQGKQDEQGAPNEKGQQGGKQLNSETQNTQTPPQNTALPDLDRTM
jgi:hypothetical protein